MQKINTILILNLLLLMLNVPAFASFADGSLGYLEDNLQSTGTSGYWGSFNNVPEGMYDVVFAYSSASDDNSWTDGEGNTLANTMDVGSTLSDVSLQNSLFSTYYTFLGWTGSTDHSIESRFYVQIFKVVSEFTLNNIIFTMDDYLIAFNDEYFGGDFDYDDMVLKASSASPTPIPGALWLLGSGLVGLLGLSRKHTA